MTVYPAGISNIASGMGAVETEVTSVVEVSISFVIVSPPMRNVICVAKGTPSSVICGFIWRKASSAVAQMCLELGVCASLIGVVSSPSRCSISDLTASRRRTISRRSLEVGAIGW